MSVRLPSYVPGQLNRPTASQINALETKSQDLTISGYNELVPVVYGEQLVSGPVIAGPVMHGSNLVYAIAVSYVGQHGIERYVSTIVNGVKEDAPAITTNPAAFSRGGVNIRLYDGKQTVPDATLRTIFGAEYQDAFEGISYAVITIPSSQSATFDPTNAVKFVVRGKKCLDPRTGLVAWTENPSLHLADYVYVSESMGSFKHIVGTEDCANWNDSLYSGLPRARTGLVVNEMLKVEQILDLFCAYAECLWSYDGETIRIIPDKPVDGPIPVLLESDIKEGTITLTGEDFNQTPTAVSVFFSDRESLDWGSLPGYAQSPKHEIYGSAATKSDVQMPPVYRRVEAERRAWMRLMRLQTPGRISWQMYNIGSIYQAGDVRRLPNIMGLRDIDVRLMSQPDLIAPGIYQMHGEIYRADHYPDGGEGIVLPEGVVFLYDGGALPLGYEQINAGNEGLPIRGGATTGIVADSGQKPSGTLSVSLSHQPGHRGSGRLPTPHIVSNNNAEGTRVPVPSWLNYGGVEAGGHAHSASCQLTQFASSDGVAKHTFKVVKKTQITNTYFPVGALVFSVRLLSKEGFTQEIKASDRYLSAGDSVGTRSARTSFGVGSSGGGGHSHKHSGALGFIQEGNSTTYVYSAAHVLDHAHEVHGSAAQELRSKKLLVYRITQTKALAPEGVIVGFGDGAVPEGWALCDGSRGTPDLRDFFIAATSDAAEGGQAYGSQNKVTVRFPSSGSSSRNGGHSHKNGTYFSFKGTSNTNEDTSSLHANSEPDHIHSTSGGGTRTFDYVPKHFSMRFIQYIGI